MVCLKDAKVSSKVYLNMSINCIYLFGFILICLIIVWIYSYLCGKCVRFMVYSYLFLTMIYHLRLIIYVEQMIFFSCGLVSCGLWYSLYTCNKGFSLF